MKHILNFKKFCLTENKTINTILDKINKVGIENITPFEKEILDKYDSSYDLPQWFTEKYSNLHVIEDTRKSFGKNKEYLMFLNDDMELEFEYDISTKTLYLSHDDITKNIGEHFDDKVIATWFKNKYDIIVNRFSNLFKNISESVDNNINNTTDYSGSYDSLRDFIYNKNLQQIFKDKYNIPSDEDWEDYTRGVLGYDEEIIQELVGKDYRIRYDEEDEMFFITKKKTSKINYKIELSDDSTILDIMDVHSEFEPRFAVILDGDIVGGTTYEIDENNDYNFDMSIMDEYQGYGISKKLVDYVIKDAKKLKCSGIKGMVVNNMLFYYLTQNGFHGSIDSDIKYVYKKL